MKTLFNFFALLFLITILMINPAFSADMNSAVGDWLTIDDKTGKSKSVVRISQTGNELRGRILDIMDPAKKDALCEMCKSTNKDKPVMGMTIMWSLNKVDTGWAGGSILDPENGKVYKAKMMLIDGGKKLNVRGFIGFALIGRTQTWIRQ